MAKRQQYKFENNQSIASWKQINTEVLFNLYSFQVGW